MDLHYNNSINLASHSTSSEVSGHGKKISTTSFGSCTTGGEYLSATLERSLKDKSELIGMYI